jgi:hypothetical protein
MAILTHQRTLKTPEIGSPTPPSQVIRNLMPSSAGGHRPLILKRAAVAEPIIMSLDIIG